MSFLSICKKTFSWEGSPKIIALLCNYSQRIHRIDITVHVEFTVERLMNEWCSLTWEINEKRFILVLLQTNSTVLTYKSKVYMIHTAVCKIDVMSTITISGYYAEAVWALHWAQSDTVSADSQLWGVREVWGCESPQAGCELSDIFLPCPFLFSCLF